MPLHPAGIYLLIDHWGWEVYVIESSSHPYLLLSRAPSRLQQASGDRHPSRMSNPVRPRPDHGKASLRIMHTNAQTHILQLTNSSGRLASIGIVYRDVGQAGAGLWCFNMMCTDGLLQKAFAPQLIQKHREQEDNLQSYHESVKVRNSTAACHRNCWPINTKI